MDAGFGNPLTYVGSKKINTVPYALVSNNIGGIGPQGNKGRTGTNPVPEPTGDIAPPGADGFDIMIMTNEIPTDKNLYVDDGTNTSDGKPHLRYKSNNIWIDL